MHDLSFGDTIVASGSLHRGLYKLNAYKKSVEDLACVVADSRAVLDAKLWHASFGHLNFTSDAAFLHSKIFLLQDAVNHIHVHSV